MARILIVDDDEVTRLVLDDLEHHLGIAFEPSEKERPDLEQFVDGVQSTEHTRRLGGITGEIAEVGVQLSASGSYRAPLSVPVSFPMSEAVPPQTTISAPVQTALCWKRADGAAVAVVALH